MAENRSRTVLGSTEVLGGRSCRPSSSAEVIGDLTLAIGVMEWVAVRPRRTARGVKRYRTRHIGFPAPHNE